MIPMTLRFLLYVTPALILSFVSALVPKNARRVLFLSNPDYSDNAKYVYDEMVRMGLDKKLDLVWIVDSKVPVKCVRRRPITLTYLYNIVTSKYIVATHGVPYWKSCNQTAILLWHAFPTKVLGAAHKTLWGKASRWVIRNRLNFLIATSSLGASLHSSRFGVSRDRILVLGQPRCDALCKSQQDAKRILEMVLGEKVTAKRTILYAPTFRGYAPDSAKRRVISVLMDGGFRRFLRDRDLLFIFKPHPHDERFFEDHRADNVRVVTNRTLNRFHLSIYDFLRAIDILVTDYSSVYKDYLLLDRPIVFYVPDLEEYRSRRGLIAERYELWTSGHRAMSIGELIDVIDESIRNPDKWKSRRSWLRAAMFEHRDGKSSERLIKHFWFSEILQEQP